MDWMAKGKRRREFSLHQYSHTDCRPTQPSILWALGALSLVVKWPNMKLTHLISIYC
jgi:hypothetical protein